MATPSPALSALINDFVTKAQALLVAESGPRVEETLDNLARSLFGTGPAKVAAPKRGRPRGSTKVAVAKAVAPKTAALKASAEEALCRFPGCPNRHSGPRYHKFCRDHFTSLTASEREKYKTQWKAAHGG